MNPLSAPILLVADDPGVAAELHSALEASADECSTASDEGAATLPEGAWKVEQAVEGPMALTSLREALWQRSAFWLAVIDLRHPSTWSGLETVQRLSAADPSLSMILRYSGQEGLEFLSGLKSLSRVLLLPESCGPAVLRQAVRVQLDRRATVAERQAAQQEVETTRRALARLRQQVDESERMKVEFVSNVSHEMRTPMNAVLGFTRLLLREPLTPEQLERLRYVDEAAQSLLEMVENVLNYAQLRFGQRTLNVTPFDLEGLVREALTTVQSGVQQKRLELLCHVEHAAARRWRGDGAQVLDVLSNLLSNAVKFTAKGAIQLRVTCDEQRGENAVLRFVVTDTGVGIPYDRQAILFRSFAQADGSTTRQFGGMGLGLSRAKHSVELMGGQIGFHSAPGGGSSFWFTVPLAAEPGEPALPRQPLLAGPGTASRDSTRRRVLVADDDPISRVLMEALLGRTDCLVDLVGNGREALELWEQNRHDLVFMDLEMPEIDGLEAIQRIRQAQGDRPVKIVVLTALGEGGWQQAAATAGADDYLAKPFSAEAILDLLHRFLPGIAERGSEGGRQLTEAENESIQSALDRVQDAVSGQRWHELETEAEVLKTLTTERGQPELADDVLRLQLAARRGDSARADQAVRRLSEHIHRFARANHTVHHACC